MVRCVVGGTVERHWAKSNKWFAAKVIQKRKVDVGEKEWQERQRRLAADEQQRAPAASRVRLYLDSFASTDGYLEDDMREAEGIVDERGNDKSKEYLINWVGWSDEHNHSGRTRTRSRSRRRLSTCGTRSKRPLRKPRRASPTRSACGRAARGRLDRPRAVDDAAAAAGRAPRERTQHARDSPGVRRVAVQRHLRARTVRGAVAGPVGLRGADRADRWTERSHSPRRI
eukprot:3377456-Prymnesium_polylepis.1